MPKPRGATAATFALPNGGARGCRPACRRPRLDKSEGLSPEPKPARDSFMCELGGADDLSLEIDETNGRRLNSSIFLVKRSLEILPVIVIVFNTEERHPHWSPIVESNW